MSAPVRPKVKTQCPVCAAQYRVLASTVGHRARCSGCGTVFRVRDVPHRSPDAARRPTEADILRWLNEGTDEGEMVARPRIIGSRNKEPPPTTAEPEPEPASAAAPSPADRLTPAVEAPVPVPAGERRPVPFNRIARPPAGQESRPIPLAPATHPSSGGEDQPAPGSASAPAVLKFRRTG